LEALDHLVQHQKCIMNSDLKNQKGVAAVIVAILLVVLIGFLGLAVDGGFMYMERNQLQNVADAAALSCVINNSAPPTACGNGVTPETGITVTTNTDIATVNPAGYTVVATYPYTPCPNSGTGCAQAVVSTTFKPFFMGVLGFSSNITIGATAIAGYGATTPCMVVTDPNADNKVLYDGGSGSGSITASSCGVFVNSKGAQAVYLDGNTQISAPTFKEVGGYYLHIGNPTTPPTVGSAEVNPFTAIVPPSCAGITTPAKCTGGVQYSSPNTGTATLNPGIYCGTSSAPAISIHNGANVTFNSGNYTICGGGISFIGNATETGTNVFFYNSGNSTYTYGPINIANGASINFTAPTTGTYANMLFMQDPLNARPATFYGGSALNLTGNLYFPSPILSASTASLIFANGTGGKINGNVVAYSVLLSGNPQITISNTISGGGSGSGKPRLLQ
jgi:hypothetical protein